jgi:hypothetical protein
VSEVALTITIKPKLVVKPTLTALKLEVTLEELAISTLTDRVKVCYKSGHEAIIEPLNGKAAVLRTPSGQYYERWVKIAAKSPIDVREIWRDNKNEIVVENALYVI